MSLVVVGSVAFDAIETPFGKTDKIIGGAGTFIALAASYFNVNPQVISVIGDDFPQEYLDLLKKHKIDIEGIQIKKGEKSFFWSGKYHNDMNNRDTLITELNVLADFDPQVPDTYQGADYLMLGNLTPLVQKQVIDRLKVRPKLIVLDTMNFWMDSMLSELFTTISMVDVLVINEEEARQLSGEYSIVKAARKIMNMGPDFLIVKKGEHGALLFHKEEIFYAPALPLAEVFDPTGAGDTFAGGFIGYLAKTDDISFNNMKNAVIMGSAMASFTVEKFGTEKLQHLTEAEIFNRVQKFIDLVKFDYNPEL
jgi:sugar/nucleoside kinase (ribokinase family)